MSHKLAWVAATSIAERREHSGCGGLLREVMIMKRIALTVACMSLLGLSITAGDASADLITNGSFEQGTFVGGSFGFPLAQQVLAGDSTTLPGWTATGELAWFASGQAGITVIAGNFALDLTGFCDLGTNCGAAGAYAVLPKQFPQRLAPNIR